MELNGHGFAPAGGFGPLKAVFASNFSTVEVTDTGEQKPKTAADQVKIQGTMESGAAFAVHYRGGSNRGTNFLWEINGTEGDIQVTSTLGHAQMMQLTIKGARGEEKDMTERMPDPSVYDGQPDFPGARNVAGIYSHLADDIRDGTSTAPNFRDAVRLHELLDRIEKSAE